MAKLDTRTVASLPGPGAGKREVTHRDDELPGFGPKVLASGRHSWLVRCRVGARQNFITLRSPANLSPADARKKAAEVVAKAKLGQDAQVEVAKSKAQASHTLERLAEMYIANAVARKRAAAYLRDVRRCLLTDAKPLLSLPPCPSRP